MVKDTIGMLVLTALVIALGTNAITDDYNIWALMVRFGG
jgi:multisubunit Na+/H+ antiporter MnhC subunit